MENKYEYIDRMKTMQNKGMKENERKRNRQNEKRKKKAGG